MLKDAEQLANILRSKRDRRGSIDFDFPEAKIILDESGKPIDIQKYEITISNKIIEEFMLCANETIAEHVFWLSKPFIYRVHELPDEEKVANFAKVAYNLGYPLKSQNELRPKMFADILKKCKGQKEEMILQTLMLRSLMKAKYSEENKGHFGLAAKYYCHFTSPIRRYPDLIVHRVLKMLLGSGIKNEKKLAVLSGQLPSTFLFANRLQRMRKGTLRTSKKQNICSSISGRSSMLLSARSLHLVFLLNFPTQLKDWCISQRWMMTIISLTLKT